MGLMMMSKKKKKALLIGLKHPQMKKNREDDDVKGKILRMKKFLMDLRGFSEENITLLIEDDEDEDEDTQPTDFNIRAEACYLIEHSNPGDILFIHLIAHGCSERCITTSDKKLIPDHHFRTLVCIARERGCTLTFVSDCLIELQAENYVCCGPGTGIPTNSRRDEKRFCKRHPNVNKNLIVLGYPCYESTKLSLVDILEEETTCITPPIPPRTVSKSFKVVHMLSGLLKSIIFEPSRKKKSSSLPSSSVILLNAFQFDYKGKEGARSCNIPELFFPRPKEVATPPPNQHGLYGGFTAAILDIIEETHGRITNVELARKAMEKLKMQGIHQKPGLHCYDHHHAYASFCAYR